jgi:meso-butanediol dehydrogenase / (S,S)-butanediol dehydrogenase / diacetyl reductase
MSTLKRFIEKTIVVTGASSGIGEETARRFSAEGANVVVVARRRERLDALVEELGAEWTLAVMTDVTKREDLEATMRAAAERFGGIDVLVSNAGTYEWEGRPLNYEIHEETDEKTLYPTRRCTESA